MERTIKLTEPGLHGFAEVNLEDNRQMDYLQKLHPAEVVDICSTLIDFVSGFSLYEDFENHFQTDIFPVLFELELGMKIRMINRLILKQNYYSGNSVDTIPEYTYSYDSLTIPLSSYSYSEQVIIIGVSQTIIDFLLHYNMFKQFQTYLEKSIIDDLVPYEANMKKNATQYLRIVLYEIRKIQGDFWP